MYRYKPQVVESAIRLAVGRQMTVLPAKGKSIRATMLQMSDWKRRAGEKHGNHWIESMPPGRTRTITVDTNFWKCQVHDAFRLLPGNPGSLTLWGRDAETHRMFSEHLNGEVAKLVESGSHTVYEWLDTPNDNHFFTLHTSLRSVIVNQVSLFLIAETQFIYRTLFTVWRFSVKAVIRSNMNNTVV